MSGKTGAGKPDEKTTDSASAGTESGTADTVTRAEVGGMIDAALAAARQDIPSMIDAAIAAAAPPPVALEQALTRLLDRVRALESAASLAAMADPAPAASLPDFVTAGFHEVTSILGRLFPHDVTTLRAILPPPPPPPPPALAPGALLTAEQWAAIGAPGLPGPTHR